MEATDLKVVETIRGGSTTDFGVPSGIAGIRRRRTGHAARTPSASPPRRGGVGDLRPGGRARDEAGGTPEGPTRWRARPRRDDRPCHRGRPRVRPRDQASASRSRPWRIGLAVEAERAAVVEALRRPSDGSPLADRRWPATLPRRGGASENSLDHTSEMKPHRDGRVTAVDQVPGRWTRRVAPTSWDTAEMKTDSRSCVLGWQ